ncbi:acyltransferase family protein [Microbacterium rhizomatis]|uniref:Acyltransferase family protein n=1 Tax=Microbacterium rhizomatis TaxID=1631477 RepID=A0A5J5J0U8_9MICO|nr:acyltransferase family protein [Microbacterium rhizomatis]KAA9106293.1 acyltransferase family protein [Microbacterium rhizomatis]
MRTPPLSAPAARVAWPDVARGLSVVLIVMLHLWATHLVFWIGDERIMSVISTVLEWTTPLRVPLFFFISGYLASRSLTRPWRAAWRGRVLSVAYLYVLWVAIIAVFVWLDNLANDFSSVNPLTMLARNIGSPETHMWYLWALVVLFVAVWATKAVPAWIVIGVGALISVGAPFLIDQPYRQVAAAVLFYALGARLPAVGDWLASTRGVWIFLAGAALYTGSMLLGPTGPYGFADPLTSFIGVAATIAIIGVVANRPWMALLRRVGRNTLPIFILNPLIFLLLNDVLRAMPGLAAWLGEHAVWGSLYAVGIVVATLAGSICIKMAADRVGLRWLFEMPDRWARVTSPGRV